MSTPTYEYDLVVIGGGSGGLAAAKEATKVNPKAKVIVFDFVQPTTHGTKWGLGGTCVNVGCIPKKLMHHAGTMGSLMHSHAPQFGWNGLESIKHDWKTMSGLIQDYIKSLNFSYRVGLTGANVKYIEGYASFVDAHTIKYVQKNGKTGTFSFASALIASGGRPSVLSIPGSELAITSDDLFWLKKSPGKTLVIGAGYIALECASFLHHTGHDVSVMVRGEILRKMDRQSGEMIGELMERDGVKFIHPASPVSLTKDNSQISVSYVYNNDSSRTSHVEQYDTVLMAVGRHANVADLNLNAVGVSVVAGKVLVDEAERTTAPHIYAIGDVAIGIPKHLPGVELSEIAKFAVDRPELTPVAIEAGLHLARRIMGTSTELMEYQYVPTSVFTSPSEYAFVGLNEEQASFSVEQGGIGAENVQVYYSRFGNIEISPLHPEYVEPRSQSFTGRNLWARRQNEERHLDWSEAAFDTELNAYVVYQPTGDSIPLNARVTNKYQNEEGSWRYDIQLDDNNKEIRGVTNFELDLQPEYKGEAEAVFIKANCLAKLICDRSKNDRVVGLHFLGPNAGEVVQGFALAVQLGATKKHFDKLVGIHPTAAEEFAVLEVTRESGKTPLKKAGCGGGSCG